MSDDLRQAAHNLVNESDAYLSMNRLLTRIEALRAALQQPVQSGWLRAVDEAMVCSHLGIANASDDYETAKKKLNDLIRWNIDVDRYFEADKRKQSEQSGWVDLNDHEIRELVIDSACATYRARQLIRATESALRAKNTGEQA